MGIKAAAVNGTTWKDVSQVQSFYLMGDIGLRSYQVVIANEYRIIVTSPEMILVVAFVQVVE